MIRMIDPASKVIKRVLNFVCIASWEEVVVSSEVRAESAETGLQLVWASKVALWVCDLKLVFGFCAWCWWLHFRVLEEYREEFLLVLHHVSLIGQGDLGFNGVAAIIIIIAVMVGFGLIVVVIAIVIFTLVSVDLGRWKNSWTDTFDRGGNSSGSAWSTATN
jgi:hypothetical protein